MVLELWWYIREIILIYIYAYKTMSIIFRLPLEYMNSHHGITPLNVNSHIKVDSAGGVVVARRSVEILSLPIEHLAT